MTYSAATELTKQNIIDAFWQLYEKGGMNQVSITKICKKAGYNRSTFYAHFKDAYDVLETIETRLLPPEAFKTALLIPLMHSENPTELLNGLIELFDRLSPYLPVLLGENGDPLFRKKLFAALTPTLYEIFKDSSYTPNQLHYIFEYQNAAILSTIASWYQNGKDISKEELIALLIQLTQNGIKHTLV